MGTVDDEILVGDGDVGGQEGAEDMGEPIVNCGPDEVDPDKTLPTPAMPPRSPVEQHEADHIPHDSWCEHCSSVFGREAAHSRSAESREIPMVSMD